MRRYLNWFAALAATAVIAACGGGGGGSGDLCLAPSCGSTSSSSSSSGGTASSLSLLVSSPNLPTNGSSTITVKVVAKDSGNGGVSAAPVKITASSGTLSSSSGVTDDTGVFSVTFDSNDDKTNRTVTLTATSGGVSASNTIVVSGTSVAFSGATSAIVGSSASLTVTVKDSAGAGVAGTVVALTSSLGNPVPASVKTDSSGAAILSYTPTKGGNDTLTATALGASATQTMTTTSANFVFVSPSANAGIAVGECRAVSVSGSGFTQAPSYLLLSASKGDMHALSDCSDSTNQVLLAYSGGSATAYVSSTSSGSSVLNATAVAADKTTSLASTSLPVSFVATAPTSLVVQGTPSTVLAGGKSQISAVLRDKDGNAVANRTIVFAVNKGGQVSPTTAVTDSSGTATTTFTADTAITGTGSATVTASLQGGSLVAQSSLTVSGLGINIVLGTDNLIQTVGTPARYRIAWGASVTDSNGSPVANKAVTISIRGYGFYKGVWCGKSGSPTSLCSGVSSDTMNAWAQKIVTACPAEDTNNNGNIDTGEPGDVDGDRVYEPNGAATVLASATSTGSAEVTVTTDANGFATFYVDYFKTYGSWVAVELKGTAQVYGNNSVGVTTFDLPVLASEVKQIDVEPAFRISPFGYQNSCNSH